MAWLKYRNSGNNTEGLIHAWQRNFHLLPVIPNQTDHLASNKVNMFAAKYARIQILQM